MPSALAEVRLSQECDFILDSEMIYPLKYYT